MNQISRKAVKAVKAVENCSMALQLYSSTATTKRSTAGFSLVELIMYLAIIGSLVGVVVGMFVSFNRLRVKSESQTELSQDARSAMERLRQELVKASAVCAPTAGNNGNTLDLIVSTPTCFRINSGVLEMSESGAGGACGSYTCSGSWNPITSSKVSVTNSDIFTRIDNTGAKSTIQIKLTLIYNNRPEYSYTTQTTVGLR